MASRPQWMRCDFSMFRNPKVLKACSQAGNATGWLYVAGLAYAVEHLTNGWVPPSVPRMIGGTHEEIAALEEAGLWIPLEITDDGGWLIHDFTEYQVTREEWNKMSDRQRSNARARWQKQRLQA